MTFLLNILIILSLFKFVFYIFKLIIMIFVLNILIILGLTIFKLI